jgi:hypothetical protein
MQSILLAFNFFKKFVRHINIGGVVERITLLSSTLVNNTYYSIINNNSAFPDYLMQPAIYRGNLIYATYELPIINNLMTNQFKNKVYEEKQTSIMLFL